MFYIRVNDHSGGSFPRQNLGDLKITKNRLVFKGFHLVAPLRGKTIKEEVSVLSVQDFSSRLKAGLEEGNAAVCTES